MKYMRCNRVGVASGVFHATVFLAVCFFAGTASAQTTKGVWWWRGEDAANPAEAARRMEFLKKHAVTEIYFCTDLKEERQADVRCFVKAARGQGMRVAYLNGDVSWIRPGNRGFAETLARYLSYQKSAALRDPPRRRASSGREALRCAQVAALR